MIVAEYAKTELIKTLYEIGAVQKGNFKLASGRDSNIYIDIRTAVLNTLCLNLLVSCMAGPMRGLHPDSIGSDEGPGPSVLLGAMLLKSAPAHHKTEKERVHLSGFVLRKTTKDHGTKKAYEGIIGERPVIFEDVATSGKSLVNAIHRMPVKPIAAIVVVDRCEGAAAALNEIGVPLRSLLTMNDLMEYDQ